MNTIQTSTIENMKADILKAISEDHTSAYKFISSCVREIELDLTVESKIAYTLFNSLQRWADARVSMHKALRSLILTATNLQSGIENNLSIDGGWIASNRYEEYLMEAKKWEQEVATATYLVGLDAKQKVSLFAKLSSLIEYK